MRLLGHQRHLLILRTTRLYSGNDGESHFEELPDLPIKPRLHDPQQGISEVLGVRGIFFHTYEEGYFDDWHTENERYAILFLSGKQEIEVGDGTKRLFQQGDLLIAEDLTGKGHRTRGIQTGQSLIAILNENWADVFLI